MTHNFQYKRISKDFIPEFTNLFNKVFEKNKSVDFFERKFDTAYTGVSYLGYLAFDGDKPIAFYGVIPTIINVNNQTFLAAQSADTMTDPDYRKLGLFYKLAERTYSLAREEGVKYIFGFPNKYSYKGFLKLGWLELEYLQEYRFRVYTFPLLLIVNKFNWLRKPYLIFYRFISQIFGITTLENYPKNIRFEDDKFVPRTKGFLNYKFKNGGKFMEMKNAYIWYKLGRGLIIGDIFFKNNFAIIPIIKKLKLLSFFAGIHNLRIDCAPGSKIDAILNNRQSIKSLPLMYFPLQENLPIITNMNITAADLDTF